MRPASVTRTATGPASDSASRPVLEQRAESSESSAFHRRALRSNVSGMPRVPPAFAIAGVFFAQATIVLIVVQWASPGLVFFVAPVAGVVGAGTCLAARRAALARPASE